MKTMKKLMMALFFLSMITTVACQNKKTPQDACGFNQNEDGQRISWKASTPIKLYYDAGFPDQYKQSVVNAINTWHKAIGREVFMLMPGVRPSTSPGHDGVNVIYWMSSWDMSSAATQSEQANTELWMTDNQILEADVMVNGASLGGTSLFSYSTNPVPGQVDVESLVLHELGHVLGLKHITSEASVMAPRLENKVGEVRRTLFTVDYTDIKCEY